MTIYLSVKGNNVLMPIHTKDDNYKGNVKDIVIKITLNIKE